MDYQFSTDLYQQPVAKCSMEHEAFGHWLTDEIGKDTTKLIKILKKIDQLESNNCKHAVFSGTEFQLRLNQEDAIVFSSFLGESPDDQLDDVDSALFNHDQNDLGSMGFDTDELSLDDQNGHAECGLEDFKDFLLSWQEFISNK